MRDLLSKKSYISWDKTACLMPNSARRNNTNIMIEAKALLIHAISYKIRGMKYE